MRKSLQKHKMTFLFIVAVVFTSIFALTDIVTGNIPFWYDPARDFLAALDNLHKLTLIGPTTGISGLFYGPYWVWLLSFGLLFSKDPRFVVFLVLFLPYFLVFPYILYKFSTLFGRLTVTLLWILFAFSFARYYGSQPWNPNLAPLLFLLLIVSLLFTDFKKRALLPMFISGLIAGLLTNFHIAFGSTVLLGSVLFIIIYSYVSQKHKGNSAVLLTQTLLRLVLFGLGTFIMFLPYFLFEVRHGFLQTKTLIAMTLGKQVVVGVTGLTKLQIIQEFVNTFARYMQIPFIIASLVLLVMTAYLIYSLIKKKFTQSELKLVIIFLVYTVSLAAVYLSAKNPVWSYHFVGVEILFLLFSGIILSKSFVARVIVSIWVLWLSLSNTISYTQLFKANPLANGSLYTKEHMTNIVVDDAGTKPYTVYAYNPSIYTYDFSYLFRWLGNKDVPYDPGNIHPTDLVYLVIPNSTKNVYNNFIGSRTPDNVYKTAKEWAIPDGSRIIKRVKK